ncbi:TolC family protein [Candidatus Saganbacteria bacterium]|nr:TolC family protein [Candidatus Saganbacteria bacterium]
MSESVNIALKSNQSILAASQEVQASQARFREALLNWLPKFDFNANVYHYKKEAFQDQSITSEVEIAPGIKVPASLLAAAGSDYYYSNLGLSVTNLLFDSGKVSTQITKASIQKELAKLKLLETEKDTAYQIKENYYKLIELKSAIALQKRKLGYYKSLYQIAQKKYQEEIIGDIDMLDNKISVLSVEHDLNVLNEEKSNREKRLLKLLNSPFDLGLSLETEVFYNPLPIKDLAAIKKISQENNSDLKKSYLDLQLKETEINLSKSDLNPQAEAYANLNKIKTADTLGKSLEKFDQIVMVGVRLDWPFFDTGKTWNKIAAANWDYKEAKNRFDELTQKIILDTEIAFRHLNNAKILVEIAEARATIAAKRLENAERFYKREKISYSELELKQIISREAQLEAIRAKIAYNLAKEKLEILIGGAIQNEG